MNNDTVTITVPRAAADNARQALAACLELGRKDLAAADDAPSFFTRGEVQTMLDNVAQVKGAFDDALGGAP